MAGKGWRGGCPSCSWGGPLLRIHLFLQAHSHFVALTSWWVFWVWIQETRAADMCQISSLRASIPLALYAHTTGSLMDVFPWRPMTVAFLLTLASSQTEIKGYQALEHQEDGLA